MKSDERKPTTTDAGIPVSSDEFSLTVGPDGPILLQDSYLIEQMADFNRERIPERQPHAKGSGAFGCFEVIKDVSAYTKAAVFQRGAKTDTLIRFSTVAGERGSPDTWRDVRGFALRFYTSEGNYDMVGNNTPVFFLRDPMKFQHFIRSQKRRVDSGLRDNDMQWDFWTLSPESAHQVTILFSDRGIPKTWRNMNGYSSHTYMWVNAKGDLVPGIGPSPDKMLLARLFSYADAHRARLGVNYKQIPVNRPRCAVHSYSKDGAMRVDNVSDPVYAPNSKGGPKADGERYPQVEIWGASGEFVRAAYTLRKDDDDWGQPGTLVRKIMDDGQRDRLVSNVVGHLKNGVSEPVLQRVFQYWRSIDKEIGDCIAKGVTGG